jgi:hypothetical protein
MQSGQVTDVSIATRLGNYITRLSWIEKEKIILLAALLQ